MAMKCRRTKYPEQKRLISLLWRREGGLSVVAEKLEVTPQLCYFWREQGYVPLKRVVQAAKTLRVPPYALNFVGYKAFIGDTETTWPQVVKSLKLKPEEVKFVLGTK